MAEYGSVRRTGAGVRTAEIDAGLRAHMSSVYGLMSVAMLITAIAAWGLSTLTVTTDPNLAVAQVSNTRFLTQLGVDLYTTGFRWIVMLAPLAFVIGLSAMINRLSLGTARVVFFAFAASMGISISSIFAMYTGASIVQIFLITAIAFASLSLWGYTTKKDISGWGSFLMMGVVGLILVGIVNIWLQSEAMMFAYSAGGVLIFAGLTAYDTQKIKTTYLQMRTVPGGEEWLAKGAIMGALSLYLDFVNMFLMLLRLFGSRD